MSPESPFDYGRENLFDLGLKQDLEGFEIDVPFGID